MKGRLLDRSEVWIAVLVGLCAHVMWGFGTLLTRVALRSATPSILLSVRFLIAFASLLIWGRIRGEKLHLRGKKLFPLIVLAVCEPFCLLFESYGILYSNASFAGIMIALTPVFSISLAALLLKEYPAKIQLLFCILPIAGAICITMAGRSLGIVQPLGILFLLLHDVFSGTFKTYNRSASVSFSPYERTFVTLTACMVVFTVSAIVSVKGNLNAYLEPFHNRDFVICVLILGIFCYLFPNLAVNYAAAHISVAKLSSFGAITTLCSALGGIVFLHEPVSALSIIGGILIIYGTWKVVQKGK